MSIKIFISHSSKDKEIVDSFIDNILRLGIGFPIEEIFCTTSEGSGIKSGEDWRMAIKDSFNKANVIILIITPNYKGSEICQNEMGAALLSDKLTIPLILEPITFKSVGVLAETKQIEKLTEEGLDYTHAALVGKFPDMKSKILISVWNSKKKKFMRETDEYLKKNPFPKILSQKEIKEIINKNETLTKDFDKILTDNEMLKKINKELELAKDKKEVKAIKEKYDSSSVIDEFDELVKEARDKLELVNPVVRTVIYNTMYNEKLEVSMGNFNMELGKARAQKYIDEYDKAIWSKPVMQEIKNALDNLKGFIDKLSSEDFYEIINEYNEAGFHLNDINCSDLDFWLDILEIKMDYIA